jgi:predicted nucleic acid-binding protein
MALDADVMVAAMRSQRGASAAILSLARIGYATMLASIPLAMEYEAVCREAEHRLAAGVGERDVNVFLDAVIALAEPVPIYFLWRPQLRDPGDERALEAAVNGRANVLVTFDVADFGSAPARFGIDVLLPRSTLSRLRS